MDHIEPRVLVGVIVILALALAVAASAAVLFRQEARYRRHRESIWRSRANVRLRLLRSVWGRKVGPDIDERMAGRILAALCSQSETIHHAIRRG